MQSKVSKGERVVFGTRGQSIAKNCQTTVNRKDVWWKGVVQRYIGIRQLWSECAKVTALTSLLLPAALRVYYTPPHSPILIPLP